MESAAARAYLGADVTARRAHNTCIVTCALGRVRFEVNDKGNTQHVSRFHPHRIVPTVFSPTSPSCRRTRNHAAASHRHDADARRVLPRTKRSPVSSSREGNGEARPPRPP